MRDRLAEKWAEFKRKAPYELDRTWMKLGFLGPQDWGPIDKYFIVSTGRTGTRFFSKFLRPLGVYALHEPRPTFLQLAIDYARGLVSREEAAQKIRRNRRAHCRDVKRKNLDVYAESNNRYFSLLAPLTDVFTDAKVIHIVRDGRDYVRSGMSRVWYTAEDDDPRLKASYFPQDHYYKQWLEMSRFAKICWRWQKKDGFIWNWVQEADRAITVEFEDIFKADDHRGVYRIADYICLPEKETEQMVEQMMNRKVNSTNNYAIPHWREWSQERKDKFTEIAGKHMKNYYGNTYFK